MKPTCQILAIFCIASLTTTVQAFNSGSLTDKATDVIAGGSSSDMLDLGNNLLKSFQGNQQAMGAAKGLLGAFNAEDYLGAFDYYDKIEGAGLKPSQLETWNDLKNPISGLILDKNVDFKDAKLSELVGKVSWP